MRYKNGDYYKGNWMQNMKNGNGVYICMNGDKYEGEFICDKK